MILLYISFNNGPKYELKPRLRNKIAKHYKQGNQRKKPLRFPPPVQPVQFGSNYKSFALVTDTAKYGQFKELIYP